MAPFLRSARLDFHPVEKTDAAQLASIMNEADVRRFLDARVFPLALSSEEAIIANMADSAKAGTDFVTAIRLRGSQEILGATGLHHIHPVNRRAEWGIVLAMEHWNQGYGAEIARTILEHAFSQMNLHSVFLRVRADHTAAVRCYEKAGCKQDGHLRDAVFGDGEFHDQLIMSALRPQWT